MTATEPAGTRRRKMQRKRKKRRQAALRAVLLTCLMAVIVIALRTAEDYLLSGKTEQENTQAASVAAKPPEVRQSSQIYADLQQYAASDKIAAEIYENRELYPENLLAAYLNNPEMEEFAAGYLNADLSLSKALTAEERKQDYPLLLQWDKRWGYAPYGGSIIGLSGCGPTCLSMVLISLTGNTDYTPDVTAKFSEENGYYVEGSGTAWSLMTEGAARLGLSARELSLAESVMKSALDAGEPIICSMGAGDFTTQGHFILIYGYDGHGFLVNDPNCIARSSQSWSFDKLQGQIKNLWAYQKAR